MLSVAAIISASGFDTASGKLAISYIPARPVHSFRMIYEPTPCHGADRRRNRQFFVSRHPGAIEWARRHPWGPCSEFVRHLDIETVSIGDVVIGTLPVHQVVAICARGALYLHLMIELSDAQRGKELSADDLDAAGARLVPFTASAASFSPELTPLDFAP